MPKDRMKLWFNSDAALDQQLKDLFTEDFTKLEKGEYEKWKDDHDGRLATVIMYDQFSRVMFRKDKKAFSFDDKALAISKQMIANNYAELKKYHYFEMMFLCLPLEHSENKEDGNLSVFTFETIAKWVEADKSSTQKWAGMIKFAVDHNTTIQKFGRYPYRNAVLGRESTPEEVEYLKTAKTYGQ